MCSAQRNPSSVALEWSMGFASLYHPTNYGLRSRPDVQHIAVLGAEILDPARAGGSITACLFAIDRNQRGLHVRLHLAAVAADIDDRTLLEQAPRLVLLRGEQM